jgi:hypothetical protein
MTDACEIDGIVADELPAFLALREKVRGTNISERTLLATDYLNHFNEIVMLLDLLADAPECFEDARQWAPKSYPDHFRDSAFRDKALAIEAYEAVPAKFRRPFEETVAHIDTAVLACLEELPPLLAAGDAEAIRRHTGAASRMIQEMIDRASAIIHGADAVLGQTEIDALLVHS